MSWKNFEMQETFLRKFYPLFSGKNGPIVYRTEDKVLDGPIVIIDKVGKNEVSVSVATMPYLSDSQLLQLLKSNEIDKQEVFRTKDTVENFFRKNIANCMSSIRDQFPKYF